MYNFKRRIGSPRDALVLVGNLTFARLCFTLSLEPVLHKNLPGYDLDLDDLWKHSLATAYGAAFLVKSIGLGEMRDRAFTAGLLHDIGKLVLDQNLAEGGMEVGASITMETERQCTGFDHAEAGAALLESWDVPEQVVEAVKWHHSPLDANENKRMALAVSAANKIGHFAIHYNPGSPTVVNWLEKNFDSSDFPLEAVGNVASVIATKHKNIMALALGPGF